VGAANTRPLAAVVAIARRGVPPLIQGIPRARLRDAARRAQERAALMTTLALAKCRFKSFVQVIEQAWLLPLAPAGVDAAMSAATP